MANMSIKAAFERLWQHVVAALGEKSNIGHSHDDKYYTEAEIDEMMTAMTIAEIDAICTMDDITALVIAEYLSEATDSEGNILTDNQDNTYVF